MIVATFGSVGYWAPLLAFLCLITRYEILKALFSANVELLKLGLQVLMFIINICAFQFRFPFLGAFLMFAEFALAMYYLWDYDLVSLAMRSLFKMLFGLFTFVSFADATEDADHRIAEMQEMINMVLEDNKKLTLELEALRAEMAKNSQSLFHQLASLTSGTGIAFEVAVLLLLVLLICAVMGVMTYLICRNRHDDYFRQFTIQNESYRAGSEFFSAATPKAVVRVADADNGQYLGHGSFAKHPTLASQVIFLTAKHVVENADTISIRHGNVNLSLTTVSLMDLGHDIVGYVLPFLQVQGIFGLNKPDLFTLSPEVVNKPIGVTAHAAGQSSIGTVRAGNSFGTLAYTGSTLPGFSGTPYFVGKIIHGIHTGSCASTNLGVESALILARLKFELKKKGVQLENDDTASYVYEEVMSMLQKGKQVKWNYYGGDQYEVQIKGKYFVVYNDDMAEMGLIERAAPAPNTPKTTIPKPESELRYDDSENCQRGSALVQAPGAQAAQTAVPPQGSTTSRPSPESLSPPAESTSPNTSLPPSISAQLGNLSELIQELVRQQQSRPVTTSAAGSGPTAKSTSTMRGPSVLAKTMSRKPSTN